MHYTGYDSPVGPLLLVGDASGLHALRFPIHGEAAAPDPAWREDREPFDEARRQLDAYFDRSLERFELTLAPQGTPFQQRVWGELRRIPFGTTISYGQLARRVGDPNASRAVGAANGKNPIPIIVPCHRVIGADGSLTGFGGGIDIKHQLLDHEQQAASLFA